MNNPLLIQGGMGIGVSNWRLAKAVSMAGQLGVISGVALDGILARRLQDGDPGGHMRRALAAFPFQDAAQRILKRYFVPGGIKRKYHYAQVPKFTITANNTLDELNVAANFSETWLAKEGHTGLVGVNYLEKVQLPNLSALYGTLLAGIDYVIMGAGIPIEIPGVLRNLVNNQPAKLTLDVDQCAKHEKFFSHFDPKVLFGKRLPSLKLPKFMPIVSSNFLAKIMIKKSTGPIDGFVIEGPSAGGHNAPPRGKLTLDEYGEPIYGTRDHIDTDKLKDLGIPFWLAGSYGNPTGLQSALASGASGVQVGSPFALCKESGIIPKLKDQILRTIKLGKQKVVTEMNASPAGFPFKVMQLPGTLSDPSLLQSRKRVCTMGYLQQLYKRLDGSIGYRCPAEPVRAYTQKGGIIDDRTADKQCLCNALYATIGIPTAYDNGYIEKAVVTIGSCLDNIKELITHCGSYSFSARDVIDYIMGRS